VELWTDDGNDAVAAFEQAAVLYFDIRAMATAEPADAVGDVDDTETAKHIRKFAFVGDHFADAWQLPDFLGRAGGIAAHDDDPGLRIIAVHAANQLPTLGIPFGRDRTRIDNAHVGRLGRIQLLKSQLPEAFSQVLRFVLVYLATKRCGFEFSSQSINPVV